ncbi:UbiE/COQ5 methyltransferase [Planctomycetes bacterium Pan216]|uniref:Demethylmenaquinone methyltransferase n=1 Tax=Kolteria novifilia TaxID=2527975 RepID=A0A518B566_9BACT|nr:UbiE/COQ5 methyltransferase [Planctomycetes bacterium Pan216]
MPVDVEEKPEATSAVDKSGERVRAMFAGVASRYDLLNHLLSLNIDKRWRRFCVRTVPPKGSDPILDVCTGTGDLALAYDQASRGEALVLGSDFCHEMLTVAKQKIEKRGRHIPLIEADAQDLPFPSDHFQIVSVAFGLRNVSDTHRGLRELIRVCRPGGRVAILEFSKPRVAPLRWLYLAYFKHLLPRIGEAVSENSHDAYHYLPNSVLEFPDGPEMVSLLESMGLKNAKAHPLTFGIATLYVGQKPRASDG